MGAVGWEALRRRVPSSFPVGAAVVVEDSTGGVCGCGDGCSSWERRPRWDRFSMRFLNAVKTPLESELPGCVAREVFPDGQGGRGGRGRGVADV